MNVFGNAKIDSLLLCSTFILLCNAQNPIDAQKQFTFKRSSNAFLFSLLVEHRILCKNALNTQQMKTFARLPQQMSMFTTTQLNAPVTLKLTKPSGIENLPYEEKNALLKREQSPHLTIYKFQLTSMMSITHRATGRNSQLTNSYIIHADKFHYLQEWLCLASQPHLLPVHFCCQMISRTFWLHWKAPTWVHQHYLQSNCCSHGPHRIIHSMAFAICCGTMENSWSWTRCIQLVKQSLDCRLLVPFFWPLCNSIIISIGWIKCHTNQKNTFLTCLFSLSSRYVTLAAKSPQRIKIVIRMRLTCIWLILVNFLLTPSFSWMNQSQSWSISSVWPATPNFE